MGSWPVIRRRLPAAAFSLAAIVLCALQASALAAQDDQATASALLNTPDQVFTDVLHQSIGAPARADLGPEAAVRLGNDLLIIPHDPAVRMLAVEGKTPPPGFLALLMGSAGLDAVGTVRFVPAGFVDSDSIRQWTAADMLDSLSETVERGNADRISEGLPERQVRRWIRPPHYDPAAHTVSWAALIVPKSAPRESDGETIFHGLAFGRDGYIELTIPASVEQAYTVSGMVETFLMGVSFRPGKAYPPPQDAPPHQPGAGLAAAMGMDSLHKVRDQGSFWTSDLLMPGVGAGVAGVGAISLFFYIQRHLRRIARRV